MIYECFVSAGGLGDSVCGLYAACGLANALADGDELVFYTRHRSWFVGFAHPRLRLADHHDGTLMGVDLNWEYNQQLRTATSRKEWYAAAAARQWGLSTVRPTHPMIQPEHGPVIPDQRYVVLAPFAAWHWRGWPMIQWTRLTDLLSDQGIQVIGIHSEREPLEKCFGQTSARYMWGMSPEWIAGLLANAACVVGNDSGIPHYAGLLGAPTVAVLAQLSPRQVFSHTDVQCLTPITACSPCSWAGEKGWRLACDHQGCAALASVPAEDVARRVRSMLPTL